MPSNHRPKFFSPPQRSPEERAACKKHYEAGLPFREISDLTQVPVNTVRQWRQRENWQRPSPTQEDATLAQIVPQSGSEDTIPDSLAERAEEYEQNLAVSAVRVSRHIASMEASDTIRQSDKLKSFDGVARRALKIETQKPKMIIDIGILASGPMGVPLAPRPAKVVEPEPLTLDVGTGQ